MGSQSQTRVKRLCTLVCTAGPTPVFLPGESQGRGSLVGDNKNKNLIQVFPLYLLWAFISQETWPFHVFWMDFSCFPIPSFCAEQWSLHRDTLKNDPKMHFHNFRSPWQCLKGNLYLVDGGKQHRGAKAQSISSAFPPGPGDDFHFRWSMKVRGNTPEMSVLYL